MCSNQGFVPKTLVHILVHQRSECSLIHQLSPDVLLLLLFCFCLFVCLFVCLFLYLEQ